MPVSGRLVVLPVLPSREVEAAASRLSSAGMPQWDS